ncbi:LCP family protein [Streptomyces sp. NPDC053048]|uniref:LCP family protein n=1 Tax=Streptomyces sp. NPDC053048 TaxID=3365694 RepID=UPI0037CFB82A
MNDRQDPYAQQQVHGYDAYGQPVYRPDAPERVYDQYGQPAQRSREPRQQAEQEWIPRQAGPSAPDFALDSASASASSPASASAPPRIPEPRPAAAPAPAGDYRAEQFSFLEEPDEDSQDVIDWLKFSESRTERRDGRRRRGRNRLAALAVVLGLVVAGGITWLLLSAGGDEGAAPAAGGAQQRDVIVVHLRQTTGGVSSTALLVDNGTAHRATALLLPNALAVAQEGGGATTLGGSVQDAGTGGTRDALNALLGSGIKGSWRLDTPYLENLVELVGGITVDTNTTVPGAEPGERPLVDRGAGRRLGGREAVAYAVYRAPGEGQERQLARFGQVMRAVLGKMSGDAGTATGTVESLAQIPDPSLSTRQLGASLAHLAERARQGSYETRVLPVRPDGTLAGPAADSVVREVLGGTVRAPGRDAPPRVSVKNATGGAPAGGSARVTLVNGGFTYVDAGAAKAPRKASAVLYADDGRAGEAKEVARTLGLPEGAVRKGEGAAGADVTVVLGQDYKG